MFSAVKHIVPGKVKYFRREIDVSFGKVEVDNCSLVFHFIEGNGDAVAILVYSHGVWVINNDLWVWEGHDLEILTIRILDAKFGSQMIFTLIPPYDKERIFLTLGAAFGLFDVCFEKKKIN